MDGKRTRSDYFHLKRLHDGIYAAISEPGAGAWSNAGIVDLGGATLVIDAFASPKAAMDLRAAAVEVTGRVPDYVVQTHWHWDHILGNQVFTGARIISTEAAREMMLRSEVKETDHLAPEFAAHVRDLRAQQECQKDARIVWALDVEIRENEHLLKTLQTAKPRLPDITFQSRLSLHGVHRRVDVLSHGGGHSVGDAFVHLPADRVVFMGDLVANRRHAWIGSGDVSQWRSILAKVSQLDAATVVPGHGSVASAEAIRETDRYLQVLEETAAARRQESRTAQEVAAPIPAPYDDWGSGHVFAWNIDHLLGR